MPLILPITAPIKTSLNREEIFDCCQDCCLHGVLSRIQSPVTGSAIRFFPNNTYRIGDPKYFSIAQRLITACCPRRHLNADEPYGRPHEPHIDDIGCGWSRWRGMTNCPHWKAVLCTVYSFRRQVLSKWALVIPVSIGSQAPKLLPKLLDRSIKFPNQYSPDCTCTVQYYNHHFYWPDCTWLWTLETGDRRLAVITELELTSRLCPKLPTPSLRSPHSPHLSSYISILSQTLVSPKWLPSATLSLRRSLFALYPSSLRRLMLYVSFTFSHSRIELWCSLG